MKSRAISTRLKKVIKDKRTFRVRSEKYRTCIKISRGLTISISQKCVSSCKNLKNKLDLSSKRSQKSFLFNLTSKKAKLGI